MKKNKLVVTIGLVLALIGSTTTNVFADELQDQFLKDMAEGLNARWEYNENEDLMTRSEFVDYRTRLVNAEYEKLAPYKEQSFESEKFDTLAHAYIEALETQLHALDYYIDYESIYSAEWDGGYNVRAVLLPTFYDSFGLDVDAEQIDSFRVSGETYTITTTTTSNEDIIAPESEIELFNNEGITISVAGMRAESYGLEIIFNVENLNHHDITIGSDGYQSVVNGVMINAAPYGEVKSGKTGTAAMYIYNNDLKDKGIDKVSEVSFKFCLLDSGSYSTLFYSDDVNLSISDDNVISTRTVYSDIETVRKLQELLNSAGYDCGAADGVSGKKTNSAILAFERDHNLPENTDITPELLLTLESAAEK